jgi:response regulator NasT
MAYLVKPFQRKDLLPAIEMAVSRFAELVALEKEVGDLAGRLEARKLVDRAKGVLQTAGMTEPEAFRHIQRRSMDERRSLRAFAQDVLDADERGAARDRADTGTKPPVTVLPD